MRARLLALLPIVVAVLSTPGSGAGQDAAADPEPLLVLAASSLADVLPRVAAAWEGGGGVPVRFSFDATSRLAPQLARGAPGDVFVSADRRWMEWAAAEGAVVRESVRPVAGNALVVVVPSGAERRLGEPGDLAGPEWGPLALAGENVPAGRYAREALEAAGVWERLEARVVRGGSVRGALEWVARGEADAGVVYRTDAARESRVRIALELDPGTHSPVLYLGAVATASGQPGPARAFLDFLSGDEAAALMRETGFAPAPAAAVGGSPGAVAEAAPTSLPDPLSAVLLSLVVALAATVAGLVPAVALGWALARHDFAGKTLVTTVVLAPLVLPPVVTGFLLLSLFGSGSPLGAWLGSLGLPVPFTLLGAVIAALVVGLPLYVVAVRGAFEAVDPHYEEVSWTLGVPPRQTFRRVTLPLALPGIAAGAVLAFARALGEFGATVVLAGNVEGRTRTIALAVYTLLETPSAHRATWLLVGASVALSLLALAGFEALTRRQRRRTEELRGH